MTGWAAQKGFTIVELLIVIVVIAILAAITIVSFNGVTTRTENTKTVNGVAQYTKALHLYAVDNLGLYPATPGSYPCLGVVGTKCSNVTDGASACFSSGATTATAVFENAIRSVTGATPTLSSQSMDCNGKKYSGAYYTSADGKTYSIRYFLKGNQTCTAPSGSVVLSRAQTDDTTVCVIGPS